VTQQIGHPAVFVIMGLQFSPYLLFTLKAGITGLTVGVGASQMTLNEASLTVTLDESSVTVGVTFSMSLPIDPTQPPIKFSGIISVDTVLSLYFEAKMLGIWDRPFGIPFLSFGNLVIGVGLTPEPPWLSQITAGNEVTIRPWYASQRTLLSCFENTRPDEICRSVQMGFEIETKRIYYHAEISGITIGKIMALFIDPNTFTLPNYVRSMILQERQLVQFNTYPVPQRVPYLNGFLTIPQGFHFAGAVAQWGFELLDYDLEVILVNYVPSSLNMTIVLPPLK
jgi:hypothetical protein